MKGPAQEASLLCIPSPQLRGVVCARVWRTGPWPSGTGVRAITLQHPRDYTLDRFPPPATSAGSPHPILHVGIARTRLTGPDLHPHYTNRRLGPDRRSGSKPALWRPFAVVAKLKPVVCDPRSRPRLKLPPHFSSAHLLCNDHHHSPFSPNPPLPPLPSRQPRLATYTSPSPSPEIVNISCGTRCLPFKRT